MKRSVRKGVKGPRRKVTSCISRRFCPVLMLFAFILACRSSSRVAQVGTERKERERTLTIRDETSKRTKIVTGRRERESRETSIVEQKPKKEDIAHQQDNRPEELSTSQVYRSDLMARLEGVRPATPEEIEAEEGLMGEITGLIVEQTMTKIGYDFYEYFFLLWEAPQTTGIQDYNIYINERSSPMWGIWIWIDVNEAKVWSKILRPRSAEIEEAAMEAVEVTREYLINYEQYQFETEDMVGTGI